MELREPMLIASRLLPGVRIAGAFVSIEYDQETSEGRTQYRYFVDLPDGREFEGNDLRSGCQGGDLREGMLSLLTFLGAAVESYDYGQRAGRVGENTELFPLPVVEYMSEHNMELECCQLELEETADAIVE